MDTSPIDEILENYLQRKNIDAAPVCSDPIFLRRVTLDLAGRIPTVPEMEAFEEAPDRISAVDRLLQEDSFDRHWADLWTSMLVGYQEDFGHDREALRLWLTDSFRNRVDYPSLVTELLTASGASTQNGAVNFMVRYRDEAVVPVSRLFLGVQLDCARCHDHPYARWTEEDFFGLARFFDSMSVEETSPGNSRVSHRLLDENKPVFLTGATPRTRMWRDELALFIQHTHAFRKTFVNRIWYLLMGRGIVHAPDNFHDKNPPSVPDLLEKLVELAASSGFQFRPLIRDICLSRAYQRSSVTPASQNDDCIRCFGYRPIKPMTPEQWYRSIKLVFDGSLTLSREEFIQESFGGVAGDNFSDVWNYRETVQHLMEKLALDLTPPSRDPAEICKLLLNRPLTNRDEEICAGHSSSEVAFALLNCNEFIFNH